MAEPRLKVAVVGTGWWGEQHTRAWASDDASELCAVVGRNRERTEARARSCGAAAFTDLGEMLDVARPDLVSVCLPNLDHFEPTLQIVRADVPLFVEKPLVFDLDEADVLLREAAASDLFFAINFNHRFARPIKMAKAALDKGQVGDIVLASWRFGGEGSSAHHPFANLIETQCHAFDLLELLCGPVRSVCAQMTDVATPGEGWSSLVLSLQFASGAIGSLVGTYDSSYSYPGAHQLEIDGTAGRVTVTDTVAGFTFQPRGSETGEVWRPGYFNESDRQFFHTMDRHVRAVSRALRAGEPPPVHARAGRRALVLANAAISSFETGRRVEVSEEQDPV